MDILWYGVGWWCVVPKSAIEIDCQLSIWREEIGNRNRLYDIQSILSVSDFGSMIDGPLAPAAARDDDDDLAAFFDKWKCRPRSYKV